MHLLRLQVFPLARKQNGQVIHTGDLFSNFFEFILRKISWRQLPQYMSIIFLWLAQRQYQATLRYQPDGDPVSTLVCLGCSSAISTAAPLMVPDNPDYQRWLDRCGSNKTVTSSACSLAGSLRVDWWVCFQALVLPITPQHQDSCKTLK
jgi:hypothetical protein